MKNNDLKQAARAICLIGFVLLIAGCTSPNWQSTTSTTEPRCVVNATMCKLPCWEGMTPGVTSLSEAVELLQASPVVEASTVTVDERGELVPGSEATIYWRTKGNPPADDEWLTITEGNLAIMRNGIVDSIQLLVDPSSCYSTVGQVVEQYGVPEKMLFAPRGAVPHEVWHTLDLYYFGQGLAFVAHADRPPQRGQPVGVVYAFAPTSSWVDLLVGPRRYMFQRLITAEDGLHLVEWHTSLENWQGFADGSP